MGRVKTELGDPACRPLDSGSIIKVEYQSFLAFGVLRLVWYPFYRELHSCASKRPVVPLLENAKGGDENAHLLNVDTFYDL